MEVNLKWCDVPEVCEKARDEDGVGCSASFGVPEANRVKKSDIGNACGGERWEWVEIEGFGQALAAAAEGNPTLQLLQVRS